MRIIAATHQDLESLVHAGDFREDLFHRLNVIRVHIPSLRERKQDIEKLALHFLNLAAEELGVEVKTLSQDAIDILTRLSWPGNVRQLENTCRWLTVMASGSEILPSDLPQELVEEKSLANTSENANWQAQLEKWHAPHSRPVRQNYSLTPSLNLSASCLRLPEPYQWPQAGSG
ncbi:nitrogen regulation protein [Vibrio ishigakensis]|uniref:Nitrogen regulation protein n=1 Tax=Vibrio ishigakensis TaxID=1481914 RepID=A0A0B8QJS7_9VIBR|nr:nitrogen regulation protein [Vibrio ishigakensis]